MLFLTLKRIASVSTCTLALSAVVLGAGHAQKPIAPSAPPAHVPPEIRAAKTIFISNMGGGCDPYAPFSETASTITAAQAYEEFYSAMEKWGRYQIATSPGGAQLVFQIGLPCPPATGSMRNTAPDPRLRLVIRDTQSRAVLWATVAYIDGTPTSKSNFEKRWNQAFQSLLSSLCGLAGKPCVEESKSPPPK